MKYEQRETWRARRQGPVMRSTWNVFMHYNIQRKYIFRKLMISKESTKCIERASVRGNHESIIICARWSVWEISSKENETKSTSESTDILLLAGEEHALEISCSDGKRRENNEIVVNDEHQNELQWWEINRRERGAALQFKEYRKSGLSSLQNNAEATHDNESEREQNIKRMTSREIDVIYKRNWSKALRKRS